MEQKYIYYGAGRYARAYFERLSKKYPPLFFCDRAATGNDSLFGLPLLPPLAAFERAPNAPILLTRIKNGETATRARDTADILENG